MDTVLNMQNNEDKGFLTSVIKFLSSKAAIFVMSVIVFCNVLVLDYLSVLSYTQKKLVYYQLPGLSFINPVTPSITPVPGESPCATCAAQIALALDMIKKIQAALTVTPSSKTAKVSPPSPSATSAPLTTASAGTSAVKEYYVPFGSGSGMGTDWTDVGGMQTAIDTSLYPPIKTVTFEISSHTPTGNEIVWVRLYNATDSNPLTESVLTWTGGANQNLISNPIQLAGGSKVYKIQVKTQLQFLTNIDSARVHIILY